MVLRNEATEWCGSFRRKPTVSEIAMRPMPWMYDRRVEVSSVAKSLSSTAAPLRQRPLRSDDLPTFV